MKNILGFTSKKILITLLVLFVGIVIDTSLGGVFFSMAGVTAMTVPFINLNKTSGCNMAGVASIVYVIDINDIETFPSIGAPTTAADVVTYVGDFTLKPNKYWTTLYSTKEMGQLTAAIEGATDGKFFRHKATAFHPRTTADALGMAAIMKDRDSVVIIKEFSAGGQMRVVGSVDIPATISGSEDSGKAFGDTKGITFEIESAGCRPPMIYSGAIVTDTTVLYAPYRMAIDATTIDYSLGKRFVVGANTGAKTISAFNNMVNGDVVRVEFDSSSAQSVAFTGAFSGAALLNAAGEWFEVTKTGATTYVITDGLFS